MRFALTTIMAAFLIAGFAALAKKSTFAAALLISLPVSSILALCFTYLETNDLAKVSQLSISIFWLVLPTLLFFLLLPALIRLGLGFWPAIFGAAGSMALFFWGYSFVLLRFGVRL